MQTADSARRDWSGVPSAPGVHRPQANLEPGGRILSGLTRALCGRCGRRPGPVEGRSSRCGIGRVVPLCVGLVCPASHDELAGDVSDAVIGWICEIVLDNPDPWTLVSCVRPARTRDTSAPAPRPARMRSLAAQEVTATHRLAIGPLNCVSTGRESRFATIPQGLEGVECWLLGDAIRAGYVERKILRTARTIH